MPAMRPMFAAWSDVSSVDRPDGVDNEICVPGAEPRMSSTDAPWASRTASAVIVGLSSMTRPTAICVGSTASTVRIVPPSSCSMSAVRMAVA